MKIGVLDIQGDVIEHVKILKKLDVEVLRVKTLETLDKINGLIIPGGESTTMVRLLKHFNLWDPIIEKAKSGMPIYGTCAGMILVSKSVKNFNQTSMGLLDIEVVRNGYGRQVDSFETEIKLKPFETSFNCVFIRAPIIKKYDKVEVLGEYNESPIWVRDENIMATSFHPELTNDTRVHEYFIKMI
jgi:5'-phosphate synthase pdxT subunit